MSFHACNILLSRDKPVDQCKKSMKVIFEKLKNLLVASFGNLGFRQRDPAFKADRLGASISNLFWKGRLLKWGVGPQCFKHVKS